MQKIDTDKIMALKNAGWTTEAIAEDMTLSSETVENAIAECEDQKGRKSEEKPEIEEQETEFVMVSADVFKEMYEKAAEIGAKEALKTFEQERKREKNNRADRRLRNTKLLLRNYHALKEHAEHSVFGRTQMGESAADILESMMSIYDDDVVIDSIKRSATRTAVIVSHIDAMLGLYAAYCDRAKNRNVEKRRYEVIWDMYMAENILDVEEIAEKQNISVRNVYSDAKEAIERLSALIFGVDGLKIR